MNNYNIIFPESDSPQHLNYLLNIGSIPIVKILNDNKTQYIYLEKFNENIMDLPFNICPYMALCTKQEKEYLLKSDQIVYPFVYASLSSISFR
jgi:hypothetical protein